MIIAGPNSKMNFASIALRADAAGKKCASRATAVKNIELGFPPIAAESPTGSDFTFCAHMIISVTNVFVKYLSPIASLWSCSGTEMTARVAKMFNSTSVHVLFCKICPWFIRKLVWLLVEPLIISRRRYSGQNVRVRYGSPVHGLG